MFRNRKSNRQNRWQSGQAMAEYTILIPASIMILVSAATIATFINHSLRKTVDALENPRICEVPAEDGPESDEGPTVSTMGNHTVRLTSHVYNPGDNTTTITYRVTSGAQPSISHWVLGIPSSVAGNIISVSEQHEWTNSDPTTGVAGIKFDTGYEVDGGGGNPGGGNPGGGKGPKSNTGTTMLTSYGSIVLAIDEGLVAQVSRDITLLVSGTYEFSESQISIKAGTDTYTSTISAPTRIDDGADDPAAEDC